MPSNPLVRPALSEHDLASARSLIRAFVEWHQTRNSEDLRLLDQYFDAGAFEYELANLATKYGPPHGGLLLAFLDGEPAGCVAVRRISDHDCEMKRMFVRPQFWGRGLGKELALAIIQHARGLGYKRMLLDTSVRQTEAQGLYASIGFNQQSRITRCLTACDTGSCSWN